MACAAQRRAEHRELALVLESIPSVQDVQRLQPQDARERWPELEILVEATPTGTTPNSVMCKVLQSTLGVVKVVDSNDPELLLVVVR